MMVFRNLHTVEGSEPVQIGIWGSRIAFVSSGLSARGAGPSVLPSPSVPSGPSVLPCPSVPSGPSALPGPSVPSGPSAPASLDLQGALVFPGLINSHDHLEFNSFSALGNEIYPNYIAWGDRIHSICKPDIDRVLRIPLSLRASWGIYKNLLGGVTTVVQHGMTWVAEGVFNDCQSIHSIKLGGHWRRRLNNPRRLGRPCVIHIGEGTDADARSEVDSLLRWNWLRRPLIGVHGVAMDAVQAAHFKALVWCPQSNFFLLGKTANVDRLRNVTTLLFGTDSTLTGPWSIWDHLRCARETGMVGDKDLFDMVTQAPARIWELAAGSIAPGRKADLTIARPPAGQRGWDAFYALTPADIELVIRRGKVCLVDSRWKSALEASGQTFDGWSSVRLGDTVKFVPGDLPALARDIRTYDPQAEFPFTV